MSDIQTISQGNYILSNMAAQKLYAQSPLTTGVSGTSAYIGIEPSALNNETVLWSGEISLSSDKITLSEPFTNFERQGVYWKSYERRFYSEFSNSGIDNPFTLGSVYVLENGSVEKSCTTWKGDSTTELSYKNTSHGSITAGGTSFTNNVVPFKIVGINRKENV